MIPPSVGETHPPLCGGSISGDLTATLSSVIQISRPGIDPYLLLSNIAIFPLLLSLSTAIMNRLDTLLFPVVAR